MPIVVAPPTPEISTSLMSPAAGNIPGSPSTMSTASGRSPGMSTTGEGVATHSRKPQRYNRQPQVMGGGGNLVMNTTAMSLPAWVQHSASKEWCWCTICVCVNSPPSKPLSRGDVLFRGGVESCSSFESWSETELQRYRLPKIVRAVLAADRWMAPFQKLCCGLEPAARVQQYHMPTPRPSFRTQNDTVHISLSVETTGKRGIAPFLYPCIMPLLHTHLTSPSSALKTSTSRATKLFTPSSVCLYTFLSRCLYWCLLVPRGLLHANGINLLLVGPGVALAGVADAGSVAGARLVVHVLAAGRLLHDGRPAVALALAAVAQVAAVALAQAALQVPVPVALRRVHFVLQHAHVSVDVLPPCLRILKEFTRIDVQLNGMTRESYLIHLLAKLVTDHSAAKRQQKGPTAYAPSRASPDARETSDSTTSAARAYRPPAKLPCPPFFLFNILGDNIPRRATVVERLARSPPTRANRFRFREGSLPDSRMWESCRTRLLFGGFSRGCPVSPALSFRRCCILTSITLIGSQNLAVIWAPVHNVRLVVVTLLESGTTTSYSYNSSHPVWQALYECLQDTHEDSSQFLVQPFHELSNGFWPRLTRPHPAIQFVPKMFYRVKIGALGRASPIGEHCCRRITA
ncbi:hypothetical protein PR048_015697 [Dryococelus australis]|uniref:Uncharacterized protein n=1 Tax=Dryococelus australis TaxID=614101 RepID=A0ABQ9HHN0_9NEOP|nr:hypothetical protein PR048_015697 [Dryococelus australis]